MPKLLVFAPCQRVITDAQDNTASLIALMETLTFAIPTEQQPEPEKGVAYAWTVFSLWLREPEDEGKTFKQYVEMIGPAGDRIFESVGDFRLTTRTHRVRIDLPGIPVTPPGTYCIRLSLQEPTAAERAPVLAEWPLQIAHVAPEQDSETETEA